MGGGQRKVGLDWESREKPGEKESKGDRASTQTGVGGICSKVSGVEGGVGIPGWACRTFSPLFSQLLHESGDIIPLPRGVVRRTLESHSLDLIRTQPSPHSCLPNGG